jgi:hypothetical protein
VTILGINVLLTRDDSIAVVTCVCVRACVRACVPSAEGQGLIPGMASVGLSGIKLLGCDAEHSILSAVNMKNAWSYTPFSPCFHGVLRNYRGSM